ncbi:unnamed protein product [Hermetia illucens]|uniref:Uncharacterized protein n=1 Tax=Hermetia illucens TaxID=343691 RepID=A0A7R8UZN2_HERIL|nr:unnamed protein product [Hermetia illucens]
MPVVSGRSHSACLCECGHCIPTAISPHSAAGRCSPRRDVLESALLLPSLPTFSFSSSLQKLCRARDRLAKLLEKVFSEREIRPRLGQPRFRLVYVQSVTCVECEREKCWLLQRRRNLAQAKDILQR